MHGAVNRGTVMFPGLFLHHLSCDIIVQVFAMLLNGTFLTGVGKKT